MTFDTAFDLLMINEGGDKPDGGYVNDPSDNGGETKYGISHAANPQIDVPNLTLEQAKAYYAELWTLYKCDKMPWAIGWTYFDAVVNSGPAEPNKWLQRALGVVADGVVGPATMKAVSAAKTPLDIARDITLMRRDYCEGLHNYDKFRSGWNKRHLDTLIGAVQWAS